MPQNHVTTATPLIRNRQLPPRNVLADSLYPFRASSLLTERIVFFRRLSLLLRAGVPLHQALGSLAESARNREWKAMLQRCLREVTEGAPLSGAFAAHPLIVTEAEVALMRAAEAVGALHDMADRIASYLEEEQRFCRFQAYVTLYPKIVAAAFFVIWTLFVFIRGGNVLGPPTALVSLLCLRGLVAGIRSVLARRPRCAVARASMDRAAWNRWPNSSVIRGMALARFSRVLGLLYRAGLPLITALPIAARASETAVIEYAVDTALVDVERGRTVSDALSTFPATFPPEWLGALQSGEESGRIDEMMAKIAETLEPEARERQRQIAFAVVYLAPLPAVLILWYIALKMAGLLG